MLDRSRRCRRSAYGLGLLLFVSYAYFYQAGGWNQNSRFALVRAVVERHTLRIDAFQESTGDKAIHGGHFYSDKAPGAALLAIPVVAVGRIALQAAGIDSASEQGVAGLSYLATIAVDGVPTVAAALCLGALALALFGSEPAAVFVVIAFGLATPAWPYATLFMGHALAASCLVFAFAAVLAVRAATGRHDRMRWGVAVGVALGWAMLTDFTTAVPAAFLATLAIGPIRARTDWRAVAGAVAAGAVPWLAVLAAYNVAAFGSPFSLGYAREMNFSEMSTGLFGITYPRPHVILSLLAGRYRGLLPLAPVLAFAPFGWWQWRRKGADAASLVAAIAIPAYYLLLNASYAYWQGGDSYGPRQMAPALPFLALALAPAWASASRSARAVLLAACACAVAVTFMAVSTTAQPSYIFGQPLSQLWWPAFKDGDLSLNQRSFTMATWDPSDVRHRPDAHRAWNVGELLGLRGKTSLAPLVVIALGAALFARRAWREPLDDESRNNRKIAR